MSRARWLEAAKTLGVVAVAGGCLAALGSVVFQTGAAEHQEQADWRAIAGPACQMVDQPSPAWLGGPKPIRSYAFEGVRFWFKHGEVYCSGVREGPLWASRRIVACQFARSGLVGVDQDGSTRWFTAPRLATVTVRVRPDGPSCMVGGWLGR